MSANIRRQFQRVQQRLDQTIGRAEKSQVLSDDQQVLEKRVEQLRSVCQNVSKKLQSCLVSQGQQTDPEKLLKKLPWYGLSQSLLESSELLGMQTCIGQMFQLCGDAEGKVAKASLDLETNLESMVLKPMTELLEVDVPSIQKLKKQLSNRALDMDSAKTRYTAAFKQLQQGTGVQAKVDAAKEEVEDACAKMEQTRDQLATEMYAFVAKESTLSQLLLDLVKTEADYHQRCLHTLSVLIPQLEENLEFSIAKPVFGLPLEQHLENSEKRIASILVDCITALNDYGLEEEGLFRLAGSALKVKKLKAALNSCSSDVVICPEEYDPHVVATVMKQYLRELPEPLMTFELYHEWTQILQLPVDHRVAALQAVVSKLPKLNEENLRYLITFLAKVAEFSDVNKMTPSNLALVMAPNLLWPPGEAGLNVMTTGIQSAIVELLIVNAAVCFPDRDPTDGGTGHRSHDVRDANCSSFTLRSDYALAQPTADNIDHSVTGNDEMVQSEKNRITTSRSPSIGKRSAKKAPAPRPPTDGALAALANADAGLLLSPPLLQLSVTDDPPLPSSCPETPSPISPRIARPKERPPERPQAPPERPPPPPVRNSVPVPSSPCAPDIERSRSPSLTGASGDNRSSHLYPILAEFETGPSANGGRFEKGHSRNRSDTGVSSRPARPMPPPPPQPVNRESSIGSEPQI